MIAVIKERRFLTEKISSYTPTSINGEWELEIVYDGEFKIIKFKDDVEALNATVDYLDNLMCNEKQKKFVKIKNNYIRIDEILRYEHNSNQVWIYFKNKIDEPALIDWDNEEEAKNEIEKINKILCL
ncbi:hypothetical protein ABVY18_004166 [Vibrio parahaemolyticus]|nr:hypothetical protein [Vibrio parahaemolyticus]EGR3171320.1 hypothetical protein [Vibrio parahaemolyticus]EJC6906661.1 hypothetical protein [Vibrio parahaemolyticus]EJC7022109.1 hypothetical protein [Vibrio parahaemolyticus]EJG0422935.1 hypothetical protein [Vibrio parahaemolyticus]